MVFPIARFVENQSFKLVGSRVAINRMVGNAQALLRLPQKVALHLKSLGPVKRNSMLQIGSLRGTGNWFVDLARSDDQVE